MNGPSPETFERIKALMPKFIREATASKSPSSNGSLKKACAICLKFYGNPHKADAKPVCPSCRKQLAEGFCAFVTLDGRRHAFFKHEKMPKDWVGQIFTIPEDRMAAMEARFVELKKEN